MIAYSLKLDYIKSPNCYSKHEHEADQEYTRNWKLVKCFHMIKFFELLS